MAIQLQDVISAEAPMDKRKKKTRIAIEYALLELMETKPLDSISISELAEKADVNRKTFYNNYNSVDEVIEDINKKISLHFFNALPDKITINNEIEVYHLLKDFTKALEPNKETLRRMARNEHNVPFVEYFKEQILPYVKRNLESYHIDPALTPYIKSYIVNGLSSIFYEWINDTNLNSDQVALLSYNLLRSAIQLDNYKDIHVDQ